MAYVLRESFTPGSGNDYRSRRNAMQGQSFTAVSTHSIDRIDVKLKKDFSAPGRNYQIRLYAADGDGFVTGLNLNTYGGFNEIDLTTDYVEYSFTSGSYVVSSGNDYVITVQPSIYPVGVGNDPAPFVYWFTGSGYTDGTASRFIWPNWLDYTPNDRWFKTYEESGAVVYTEGTKTVSAAAIVDYITGPGKAWNPRPTDDQENTAIVGQTRINTLLWNAPTGETPDYLVYYRAQGGAWVLQETITDDSTSHTLSSTVLDALSYYSIYEWRVDTRDAGLTTTGDTWTFITQQEAQFTDYTRRSDYDADKVWQPGTGWVDINTFEFTGGGRYKGRVLVIGHKVVYFGDL